MPAPLRHETADTKERILEAAETLFMEQGFAATTLRQVTTAAKVNLAAVNYHYGSKEELVRAVLTRRLFPLNRDRVAQLERAEQAAGDRALTADEILEAMVAPALHLARDPEGGAAFLRILGRAFSEPAGYMQDILPDQYAQVVQRFKAAFARALPWIPMDELVWRMHFMFGAMAYVLAGHDALQLTCKYQLPDAADAGSIVRRLKPFLLGGLMAPLPDAATTNTQR